PIRSGVGCFAVVLVAGCQCAGVTSVHGSAGCSVLKYNNQPIAVIACSGVMPRCLRSSSLAAVLTPPSNGLVVLGRASSGWAWVSQVNRLSAVISPATSLWARRNRRWVYHHFWPGFTCEGRSTLR